MYFPQEFGLSVISDYPYSDQPGPTCITLYHISGAIWEAKCEVGTKSALWQKWFGGKVGGRVSLV